MTIIYEPNCDPTAPRLSGPQEILSADPMVLPRPKGERYGECQEWMPKFCDKAETIPEREWKEIIRAQQAEDVSMRELVWMILDQNGRGSCSQEEAAGATMLVRSRMGQHNVGLNPWPGYWRICRGRGGTSISSAYKAAKEWGFPPFSLVPRSGSCKRQSQSVWDEAHKYRLDEVLDVSGTAEGVSALLRGYCVGYGRANHAILAVAAILVNGVIRIVYLNSWGKWGDQGFGIDPLRSFGTSYGMFASRTAVEDGSAAKAASQVNAV